MKFRFSCLAEKTTVHRKQAASLRNTVLNPKLNHKRLCSDNLSLDKKVSKIHRRTGDLQTSAVPTLTFGCISDKHWSF